MNTTRKFDIWWRETGQFLPVAVNAKPEELEKLREFASAARTAIDGEVDELMEELKRLREFAEAVRYEVDKL